MIEESIEAFPTNPEDHCGITRRDYFAIKALQGLLACPYDTCSDPKEFVKLAFRYADLMLSGEY